MGKTKTAFVAEASKEVVSGEEKYQEKLKKKAAAEAAAKAAAAKKSQKKEETGEIHIAGTKGGQRVKMITAEPLLSEVEAAEEAKKTKKPRVRSKKFLAAKAKVDKSRLYSIPEAIKLVKETSISTFDGTFEAHLVVKKQGLTVNVTLPFSAGKEKKVEVADEKTIEKLKAGKIDFDVLLATAEMMPKLVAYARLLGPKGMMPNPKNGTLIKSPKDASKFSASTLSLKTQKDQPVIHTIFGKVSQPDKELIENIESILNALDRKQIIKAVIKSSISPAVKLSY